MDIEILKNFIEITNYSNLTKASNALHISQSALTKQLHQLEKYYNTKIFNRHHYGIELTSNGQILKDRINEILQLERKTKLELKSSNDNLSGNIYIGAAESVHINIIARLIKEFKNKYLYAKFHFTSGDTEIVSSYLDKNLLDFGIICNEIKSTKYEQVKLKAVDKWVIIAKSNDKIASKKFITKEDLIGLPLICSRQAIENEIPKFCGKNLMKFLNFTYTSRLAYNASIFVKEGLGYYLTFDKLVNTSKENGLIAIPLKPMLTTNLYFIWKKNSKFSNIASAFLTFVKSKLY